MASRKERHENFVSNLSGGEMMEIYMVCLVFTMNFIISGALRRFFKKFTLAFEFITAVIPGILLMTVFSDYLHHLLFIGLTLSVALSLLVRGHFRSSQGQPRSFLDDKGRPAFLSSFRGIGLLTTSICILAVDFPAFPRRFAKTETYGTALMDFGVGGFALMMGLVAPEARMRLQANTIKTIVPLLVLGILRVLSVKTANYQEHVSEYGTHWNFFFTLAFTKLITSILLRYLRMPPIVLALFFSTAHEMALRCGLSGWILHTSRTNLLTTNKEGIGSLLGYVSILFWGIVLGQFVYQSIAKQKSERNHYEVFNLLARCFCGFMIGYLVTRVFGPVSRSMANGAYIGWTVSLSCLILIVLLLGHVIVLSEKMPCPGGTSFLPSSMIDQSILSLCNNFAMVHFLVSNLLTGLTNFIMDTLVASNLTAVLVLIIYQCAVLVAVCAYEAFSQ